MKPTKNCEQCGNPISHDRISSARYAIRRFCCLGCRTEYYLHHERSPVAPKKHHTWRRTREPHNPLRHCSLCGQEIFRIRDHSGVVIFDNRFTCAGCTSKRRELEDKTNMDWVMWV